MVNFAINNSFTSWLTLQVSSCRPNYGGHQAGYLGAQDRVGLKEVHAEGEVHAGNLWRWGPGRAGVAGLVWCHWTETVMWALPSPEMRWGGAGAVPAGLAASGRLLWVAWGGALPTGWELWWGAGAERAEWKAPLGWGWPWWAWWGEGEEAGPGQVCGDAQGRTPPPR